MLAKTHRSFAVASASATLLVLAKTSDMYTSVEPIQATATMGIVIIAAFIAGTLPDIDQYIPFISHRGITHAIWIPLLLGYATWMQRPEPYICAILFGVTIGYTSHIIGDAFSAAGVAFFYPLQRYQRTGSGAFYVKGFRGIFQPLYSVGQPSIIPPKLIYYAVSALLILTLIQHIW